MTALLIEPIRPAHAQPLFEPFSARELYTYIPEKPPKSIASMEAEYAEFAAGAPADAGEVWLNWVIRDANTLECLGTLQATKFADQTLWVGYKVAPRHWGQGIATRGLQWALLQLAQRFPGEDVLAAVDTRNVASVRVLQKCGFEVLRHEPAELRGEATEDVICIRRLPVPAVG